MTLPDLPSDVGFTPCHGTTRRWRLHRERFREKPFFKILWHESAVAQSRGCSLLTTFASANSSSTPNSSAKGWAAEFFGIAFGWRTRSALPVRLEYLKWNPVGTLYRQHGFAVIGETENHWLMERPAEKPST